METSNTTEIQEQEPTSRKVVLHFIRHGDAEYKGRDDTEGYLTDKGRQQAEVAAEKLYKGLPRGAVVEFISSNRQRAEQTIEILGQKLKQMAEEGDKNILFHNEGAALFSSFGMSDAQTQESLDIRYGQRQNEVFYWLNNPGKTPEELQKTFHRALRHFAYFAHHINPSGPDVHIIIGTHSGPSEVFVSQLLNRTSMDILANCEEFRIEIPQTGQDIMIKFKEMREKAKL